MNKEKKTLLCMYVDDFCGIEKESFNFCAERRYAVEENKIRRKSDEEIRDFPKDFWERNVSAVTLLIGKNGAGKTTLIRLLIKWLCQLSVGHLPQERGALVINVGDEDKLIAFGDGKTWPLDVNQDERKKDEINICIAKIDEMQKVLSDVRLAYYTDTMTDLELNDTLTAEELNFLQDDSLLTRLSNSMGGKYTVDSIRDSIKREEFKKQMKFFLRFKGKPESKENLLSGLSEFPIRYMKFTASEAGDAKGFEKVPDGSARLIGEAIDLWNKVSAKGIHHNLQAIGSSLLWGLFSGTIVSLLQWERTLPNLENSIMIAKIRSSIGAAFTRADYSDWDTVFKRFFTDVFHDCEREFRAVNRHEEFCAEWDMQIRDNINNFLETLKSVESGEFLQRWTPFANARNMWEFQLEHFDRKDEGGQLSLMKDWEELWEHYLTVAHLMPECRFDWKYASSGETNKANLFDTMQMDDIGDYKNMWFLLDEPDNTFHPEWKRETVRELLNRCSIRGINYQLLISTHSPIMLSDVPKQAAILLETDKEENGGKAGIKRQKFPQSSPFGQQIYTLFNDAFFMDEGIIGAFADKKIEKAYEILYHVEEQLSGREKIDEGNRDSLKYCEQIINFIEEPLLHGHLSQSYRLCDRWMKELQ